MYCCSVPGWVGDTLGPETNPHHFGGNGTRYYSSDNIEYQLGWLRCLKDSWGVDSDYIVSGPFPIPVIGSIARGTQRLNCSMRGSMKPRIEQFSR